MGVVARTEELAAGRAFLERADGLRALVLVGDPGIGKTTVWQALVDEEVARGNHVLVCRAVEAEAGYAFAQLADLLAPVVDEHLHVLPEPQRRALEVALLRAPAPRAPLNSRAVGAATHSLLARASEARPLVVAIDDLQWLDSASAAALGFALRRLTANAVTFVATLRSGLDGPLDLTGSLGTRVEHLPVGPLTLSGLFHVIRERLGRVLPRPTLQRVAHASGGNPLYALELARALVDIDVQPSPGEPLPVPDSLAALMATRIGRLGPPAREALLAAALATTPHTHLLAKALGRDIASSLAEAERAGVVFLERGRVRFVHPLLAAAVFSAAPRDEARALHAALATVATEPEERARHLALAAEGPDEAVAAALHEAAVRADARAAPEVAAELAELAVRLTPHDLRENRARRELALAEYAFRAGDTPRSLEVADRLHGEVPAGELRALVCELLVHLAYVARTNADAMRYAQEAIREASADLPLLARLHLTLARVSYDDHELGVRSLQRALELLELVDEPDPYVLGQALITQISSRLWSSPELDAELVARALELERVAPSPYVSDRASASLGVWLRHLGDFDEARSWLEQTRQAALDEGDESSLPYALSQLAQLELSSGRYVEAERLAREHAALAEAVAQPDVRRQAHLNLASVHAHAGRVDEARSEAEGVLAESEAAGDLWGTMNALHVLGLLELSNGDAAAAARHLQRALELCRVSRRVEPLRAHADLVEALVELGSYEQAVHVSAFLVGNVGASCPSPLVAVSLRARGLLAAASGDLVAAVALLEQAVAEHERAVVPFDLARTLNVLGQVRRRRGERRDARAAFGRARTIFDGLGAALWAERVDAEARRIPIKRGAGDGLTPAEQRVAELVAAGRTTREVAHALFVSPKTVEANLTRIYRKLGIRSRAELGAEMALRAKP